MTLEFDFGGSNIAPCFQPSVSHSLACLACSMHKMSQQNEYVFHHLFHLLFFLLFFCCCFFFSKKESDGGGRRLEKPDGKHSPAAAALEQKRAELCVTTQPLHTVCGQGLWPRGPQGSRGSHKKCISSGHLGFIFLDLGKFYGENLEHTCGQMPGLGTVGSQGWDKEQDEALSSRNCFSGYFIWQHWAA